MFRRSASLSVTVFDCHRLGFEKVALIVVTLPAGDGVFFAVDDIVAAITLETGVDGTVDEVGATVAVVVVVLLTLGNDSCE